MDPTTLKKNVEVTSRLEQSNLKMYGGRIRSIMEQMKMIMYQSKYKQCQDMISETEPLLAKQGDTLDDIEKLITDTEYTITTSQQEKMKQKLKKWKEEEEEEEERQRENAILKTTTTIAKSIWRDDQSASIVNAPRISLIVYMANRWLRRNPIQRQHYYYNTNPMRIKRNLFPVESEESLADVEAAGEDSMATSPMPLPPPGTISPEPTYDSDLLIFPEYESTTDTESDMGDTETVQAVADALLSTNTVSSNEAAVIMINSTLHSSPPSSNDEQTDDEEEFPFLQDPVYVKDYVDLVHLLRAKRLSIEGMKQMLKDNQENMMKLKEKIGHCDTFERTHGRHHMVDWYFDRLCTEIDAILDDNAALLNQFASFVLAFAS